MIELIYLKVWSLINIEILKVFLVNKDLNIMIKILLHIRMKEMVSVDLYQV